MTRDQEAEGLRRGEGTEGGTGQRMCSLASHTCCLP